MSGSGVGRILTNFLELRVSNPQQIPEATDTEILQSSKRRRCRARTLGGSEVELVGGARGVSGRTLCCSVPAAFAAATVCGGGGGGAQAHTPLLLLLSLSASPVQFAASKATTAATAAAAAAVAKAASGMTGTLAGQVE